MKEIYLDNAATTRPWPEVVAEVERAMGDGFGNASSRHRRGLAAERVVVEAQEIIAEAVGSGPWKVIFTSGGTEADNLAVLGTVPRGKRLKVVSSTVEHPAVEEACQRVTTMGGEHVALLAGTSGVVSPEAFDAAVDRQTGLVSLVQVASEIGTVQPIGEVARRVKARQPNCRVHTDAVQALAQLANLNLPGEVDMVSISAHKIHGPPGVGALLLRPGVRPHSLAAGGDQQDGIRPGTLNLPGIAGFAEAARLLCRRKEGGVAHMATLSNQLIDGVLTNVPGASRLGDAGARAPGLAVLAFDGVTSEVLLHALEMRGVLASSSSACHAARREPPRSLVAAGLRKHQGAVRFSLSLDTTETEIEQTIDITKEAVAAVRRGRASS